jgi:hypothetical protein
MLCKCVYVKDWFPKTEIPWPKIWGSTSRPKDMWFTLVSAIPCFQTKTRSEHFEGNPTTQSKIWQNSHLRFSHLFPFSSLLSPSNLPSKLKTLLLLWFVFYALENYHMTQKIIYLSSSYLFLCLFSYLSLCIVDSILTNRIAQLSIKSLKYCHSSWCQQWLKTITTNIRWWLS